MKDTAYAFGTAKVRAVENTLLTKADIEQLISVKHVSDALRILSDKGYDTGMGARSLSKIFGTEREKLWKLMDEVSCGNEFFKIFLYKNDYHNLKVLIKGLSSGKDFDNMLLHPYTVSPELIKDAVRESKFEMLPPIMAEAAAKAYELLNRSDDTKGACMVIDKASNEALYKGAKESENDFFIELARLMIDTANAKIALRCARIGLETDEVLKALTDVGGLNVKELAANSARGFAELAEYLSSTFLAEYVSLAESDFSAFEKQCDDLVTDKIAKAKYKAFGPEPILAYYFAKEAEIKTLHIILAGKMNGLEEDVIRKRVRKLYV